MIMQFLSLVTIVLEIGSNWILNRMTFSDDVLGPETMKRKPPLMFTPSQITTTIPPKTFTAQDAGICSNAELDQFSKTVLFSKHSVSTLQLLGQALSYSFISSNTPDFDANTPHENTYTTLRNGLHDKLSNLAPLLHLHGFQMLSYHYLDTHATF